MQRFKKCANFSFPGLKSYNGAVTCKTPTSHLIVSIVTSCWVAANGSPRSCSSSSNTVLTPTTPASCPAKLVPLYLHIPIQTPPLELHGSYSPQVARHEGSGLLITKLAQICKRSLRCSEVIPAGHWARVRRCNGHHRHHPTSLSRPSRLGPPTTCQR